MAKVNHTRKGDEVRMKARGVFKKEGFSPKVGELLAEAQKHYEKSGYAWGDKGFLGAEGRSFERWYVENARDLFGKSPTELVDEGNKELLRGMALFAKAPKEMLLPNDVQEAHNNATHFFKAALELKPKDRTIVTKALRGWKEAYVPSYPGMSAGLFNARYGMVKAFFQDKLKDYPDNALIHKFIGISHFKLGEYDGAAEHLGKALKKDPELDDYELRKAYGISLHESGKNKEAIEHLKKATEDIRAPITLLHVLATAHYELGNYDKAIKCGEKVFKDGDMVDKGRAWNLVRKAKRGLKKKASRVEHMRGY